MAVAKLLSSDLAPFAEVRRASANGAGLVNIMHWQKGERGRCSQAGDFTCDADLSPHYERIGVGALPPGKEASPPFMPKTIVN